MTDISQFTKRLKSCGFKPEAAALVVDDFLREHRGSYFELEQFVRSVERECYVGIL